MTARTSALDLDEPADARPARTPDPPKRRSAPLDAARALAVIGVVINHAVDGLVTAGDLPLSSWVVELNDALYLFRMPALALLIGLFVPGGVEKAGTWPYIRRRVTMVLSLYLVWHVLQVLVEVATSSVKNHPRSILTLLTPWVPVAQLWFLPFLAVATVAISLAAPWRTPRRAGVVLVAFLAVTLATWGWNPDLAGVRGLSLLFFGAVGATVGLRRASRWVCRAPGAWAFAGLLAGWPFVLLVASGELLPATQRGVGGPVEVLASAVAASCGVVALLTVAVLLSRSALLSRALSYVGVRTLPLFLAHVTVVAGTRVILARGFGQTRWEVLLPVEIVLGVAVPLLLVAVSSRTRWLGWLFDPPLPDLGRRAGRGPGRPGVPGDGVEVQGVGRGSAPIPVPAPRGEPPHARRSTVVASLPDFDATYEGRNDSLGSDQVPWNIGEPQGWSGP